MLEADGAPDLLVNMTDFASYDEKAWMLTEKSIRTADHRALHRFQVIWVVRDDRLAALCRDLGPVDDDIAPLAIYSGGEDTVGQLLDMADASRRDHAFEDQWQVRRESSTIINDAIVLAEWRQQIKNNRTVFGAGRTAPIAQRIGFHHAGG